MIFRTDLALEQREALSGADAHGILTGERTVDGVRISTVTVRNHAGAAALKKPIGKYVTLELPSMMTSAKAAEPLQALLSETLLSMLPKTGCILVAGLGNVQITPDALGPKCAALIFATRHISGELSASLGLGTLRPVAAIAPGVLGQTGVETAELLCALTARLSPAALIVIDALAARRLERVGTTVQLTDSGIAPGSGVGNRRFEISRRTVGVPVIAVGVPTVVDAATMAGDLLTENETAPENARRMMVTPKEIDLLIEHAAQTVAMGINRALQPTLSAEDLLLLIK